MNRYSFRSSAFFLAFLCFVTPYTLAQGQTAEAYLPLREGNRWVLRHASAKQPVSFEVLSRDGDGYRIRFESPFGSNDWTLVPQSGKVLLARFGKNGQMMDLPANSLYFDFTAPQGGSWDMTAGKMTVLSRNFVVQTATRRYESAIQIRQGKNLLFTFAPNVGFVQFGEGKNAFLLDEKASRLPGAISSGSPTTAAPPPDDSKPVQHVPGGAPAPVFTSGIPAKNPAPLRRVAPGGPLLVGITVNTFANETMNAEGLMRRWQQSIDTGANFVVSNGKWNELEPKKGDYKLDGLKFQVSEAKKHNLQIAYTLRLIDTVARTMPADLQRKKWTDPEMEARVTRLIEALAPEFGGRVKWFMLGNEIDGYFGRHPEEVQDFAQLYDRVSKRLKELVPDLLVSSTMMYGGIETLDGLMRPLNGRFDFLAITYYPIRADFTMKDPSIVTNDFTRMRNAAAGRGVVLQEIGYATAAVNGSSEEKQAQFVSNVFSQLRANRDVFAAGSFFVLADLSDPFVKSLAQFYGIQNAPTFLGFLQSTGLFDLQGKPKRSWGVFQSEMRNLRP